MKKLNIFLNKKSKNNIYVITRKNESYEYFNTEFKGLAKERDGSIIYPTLNKEESIFESALKKFFSVDDSVTISKTSCAYSYFNSECKRNISKDRNHNIIVPVDSYQKRK